MYEQIVLSDDDLRAVASFAASSAHRVPPIFEGDCPNDPRPRQAIEAATEFAVGARRSKLLRTTAWAALHAAHDAPTAAAAEAARSTMVAAGAAYLHPLADPHQVMHILGASVHAALAAELAAGGNHDVGDAHLAQDAAAVDSSVREVLRRYPSLPVATRRRLSADDVANCSIVSTPSFATDGIVSVSGRALPGSSRGQDPEPG